MAFHTKWLQLSQLTSNLNLKRSPWQQRDFPPCGSRIRREFLITWQLLPLVVFCHVFSPFNWSCIINRKILFKRIFSPSNQGCVSDTSFRNWTQFTFGKIKLIEVRLRHNFTLLCTAQLNPGILRELGIVLSCQAEVLGIEPKK